MNITSYAKDLFEENYNTEYNSVCIDKTGKERFATKYKEMSSYNNGVAIGNYSDYYGAPMTLAGLDKDGKKNFGRLKM